MDRDLRLFYLHNGFFFCFIYDCIYNFSVKGTLVNIASLFWLCRSPLSFILPAVVCTVQGEKSRFISSSFTRKSFILVKCEKQLPQIEDCLSSIIHRAKHEVLIYFCQSFLFHHYFLVPMLSTFISVCGLSNALLSVNHLTPTGRNERK